MAILGMVDEWPRYGRLPDHPGDGGCSLWGRWLNILRWIVIVGIMGEHPDDGSEYKKLTKDKKKTGQLS